eukprot:jgi/Mesen1/7269/ME000373S06328
MPKFEGVDCLDMGADSLMEDVVGKREKKERRKKKDRHAEVPEEDGKDDLRNDAGADLKTHEDRRRDRKSKIVEDVDDTGEDGHRSRKSSKKSHKHREQHSEAIDQVLDDSQPAKEKKRKHRTYEPEPENEEHVQGVEGRRAKIESKSKEGRDTKEREADKPRHRDKERDRDERERHRREKEEQEQERSREKERERLKEKEERDKHRHKEERERQRERERIEEEKVKEREKERDREKEKVREKEREREREKVREKEKEKEREKEKSREDRERRKEKERARDKEKEKRDHERERNRDKDRDDEERDGKKRKKEEDTVAKAEAEPASIEEEIAEKEQKKLDDEMEKRRRRVQEWQELRRKKEEDELQKKGEVKVEEKEEKKKVKKWTLDGEESDDDDVGGLPEDEEEEAEPASVAEAVKTEGVEADTVVQEVKEEKMEEEEEEEVDPLDAFMSSLNVPEVKTDNDEKQVKQEVKAEAEEETLTSISVSAEKPALIAGGAAVKVENGSSKASKRADQKGGKKGKYAGAKKIRFGALGRVFGSDSESESEALEDDEGENAGKVEEEDDSDFVKRVATQTKADKLPAVDHSKITYPPFRKNFYIEVKEITRVPPEEVAAYRKDLEFKIRGKDVPKPIRTWNQTGLSNRVLEVIKKLEFEAPMPIQAQALPIIMSGRDCIGIAKTGSGKTLAFVLPMLRHIMDQPPLEQGDGPIGLIMAPTRELVQQIYNDIRKFSRPLGLGCVPVYGGSGVAQQISELKRGAEIVVCTPGRMIDILCTSAGKITNLRRVTYLVMDEADRMFDMGFEPQIARMVQNIRPGRQTVLFSATFPRQVEALARRVLTRPIEIQVGGRSVVNSDITQIVEVRPADGEQRFLRLLELLGEWYEKGKILVFVHSQEKCDALFRDLLKHGYPCLSLHGAKDQTDRESTITDFKQNVCNLLIATSVAARGLDVKELELVVNFDVPNHYEDYVHRVGRTGRAGRKGLAVTFISAEEEERFAPDLLKALELSLQPVPEDLKRMADSFMAKVSAGTEQVHGSGYGGSGFKFNEEEEEKRKEIKKAQAKEYGVEDDAGGGGDSDNDSDGEGIRRMSPLAAAMAANPALAANPQLQAMLRAAQAAQAAQAHAASAAAGGAGGGAGNSLLGLPSFAGGGMPGMPGMPGMLGAFPGMATNPALAALLGMGGMGGMGLGGAAGQAAAAPTSTPAATSAASKAAAFAAALNLQHNLSKLQQEVVPEHYEAELEINDFPQHARWKVTHKDALGQINDWTGAAVTTRGQFVPPGKQAAPGERKLFLFIEGPTEASVKKAKQEIKRILEECSAIAPSSGPSQPGKYNVL